MFKIYYLEKDGIPFYIGKAKNYVRRKHRHYKTYGTNIKLEIIDEVEDWRYWEEFYIWLFKSWGFKLENKNYGGGGPTSYTEKQKLSMRKPRKPGTGDKISKSLIEGNHSKYYTQEVKDKISRAMSGRTIVFTEERKQNMAVAQRKKSKRVLMYDLQGNFIKEWESKGQAAEWVKKELNLKSNVTSQIKDCILGRQKTAFKFIWRYKGDNRELNIFNIIYQFNLSKELINTFKSLEELIKWLKENRPENSGVTIASTIKKYSKNRIYKSGQHYYSIKNQI